MIGAGLAGQIVSALSLVASPPRLAGVDLTLLPVAVGLAFASTGLVRLLGDRVRRRSVDLLFESAIGAASFGVVLWVTVAVPGIERNDGVRPLAALAVVICVSLQLLAGLLAGPPLRRLGPRRRPGLPPRRHRRPDRGQPPRPLASALREPVRRPGPSSP